MNEKEKETLYDVLDNLHDAELELINALELVSNWTEAKVMLVEAMKQIDKATESLAYEFGL